MDFSFNSVETIPSLNSSAAFTTSTSEVFKEQEDTSPVIIDKQLNYMPWGADNDMPYRILDLIESDETLSTCQIFNAEVCYGSGLVYDTAQATNDIKSQVEEFLLDNDLPTYFLGVCQDFKHFAFCVSVIILSNDGSRVVRLLRKEACYCRFAEADKNGRIPYILYANWRKCVQKEDIERIELLDTQAPWADLRQRMEDKKCRTHKFAILTRVPTPDSTYYPIPYYGMRVAGSNSSPGFLLSYHKQLRKYGNKSPHLTPNTFAHTFAKSKDMGEVFEKSSSGYWF